ncbi:uncharacterized protein LOC120481019 [Pimephales promelas]|uniref:uncharacterized protein LOC120481019 n=1 Tax=Pimephales promelas TaxID=90988 RepID=UPI001955B4D5|nr:uncharacterized protein LOC120481019 [Pimephales promelas]
MSISVLALVLVSVQQVGGKVEAIETVKVKEGDFLNLHPGLHDVKGDVQILWTFESDSQSTRVAQMHQGKIYTHYDKRLTGRVQLDRETGILTIADIRTNESGLYKAVIIVNKKVTVNKYEVEVYATVTVPAVRSSAVTVSTGTSRGSHASNSATRPNTNKLFPNHQDPVGSCGETEVLVRLVLSGLVAIATIVFLLDHIRCCTPRRGAQSSV